MFNGVIQSISPIILGASFPSPFTSWSFRRKITIDNTKVDAVLTSFPVNVPLSLFNTDFHSKVKSDGGDIRFSASDGTTQLARENRFINTGTKKGEFHAVISSVSSSVDTDFFIYYGNAGVSEPAITDTFGAENVWDSNFKGVWHLQEDPSGSAPQMLDSTSGSFDGTSNGSMTLGDSVTGKILDGQALDFEGTDDFIDMGSVVGDAGVSNFTIEAYINPDVTAGVHPILATQTNAAGNFHGWNFAQTDFKIGFFARATDSDTNTLNFTSTNNVLIGGLWTHVAWVKSGKDFADQTLYVNGASVSLTVTTDTLTSANWDSVDPVRIGTRGFGDFFNGQVDEARISWTARSAAWIKAEFNNLNDPGTFLTIGAEETL